MNVKGLKIKNKRKDWIIESRYPSVRRRIKKLIKTVERRALKEEIKGYYKESDLKN